jgi:putative transcriptional regulator
VHHGRVMDQIAPGFLIALPQLMDDNFRQTVVLLLRQDADGAMGVVVNRPSPLTVRELCGDHQISYGLGNEMEVRCGGPVQPDQGLVLLGPEIDDPDAEPVIEGLQLSASRATLERLCGESQGRFHCFSGYAGWDAGQLEQELEHGSWLVGAADAQLVLDSKPELMWEQSLRGLGIDPTMLVAGGGVA